MLNEFLPAPRDVDWDGDGSASSNDEWIELHNPGPSGLQLRGWLLDDEADGGSDPYALPEGLVLPAGGHLLVFRRESGVTLNNDGDAVRLLAPGGQVADETRFSQCAADRSISRDGDGDGPWSDALPPSPGRALDIVVSGSGYVAPLPDGGHVVGATYQHDDDGEDVRAADHRENLARAASMLPGFADDVHPMDLEGLAGFRATVPDRLPPTAKYTTRAVVASPGCPIASTMPR